MKTVRFAAFALLVAAGPSVGAYAVAAEQAPSQRTAALAENDHSSGAGDALLSDSGWS